MQNRNNVKKVQSSLYDINIWHHWITCGYSDVFAHELWRDNREGEAVSTGTETEIITVYLGGGRSWCKTWLVLVAV